MSCEPKLAKDTEEVAKSAEGITLCFNNHFFQGDGVNFKCKLVGAADVGRARDRGTCFEAIKKVKEQAIELKRESGKHKQKIILHVSLSGIRIVDETTQEVHHEHPIKQIAHVADDPDDKNIFGYIYSGPVSSCYITGYRILVVKSKKPAEVVTGTLYELFQVKFQIKQQALLTSNEKNLQAELRNCRKQLCLEKLQQAILHGQLREKSQQEENSQRRLREVEQQVRRMEQQLREKDHQFENSKRLLRAVKQEERRMEQQLREKDHQFENSLKLRTHIANLQRELLGRKLHEASLLQQMEQQLSRAGAKEELKSKQRLRQTDTVSPNYSEIHLTRFGLEGNFKLLEELREENLYRHLYELKQQLSEKDVQKDNLQRQLRDMEQQLRKKDEQDNNLQRRHREMEQHLREKDEQEENLQRQLREMEQQLRENDEQDDNLQRQLREMEQQLREKDEQEEVLQRILREITLQLREKYEQEKTLQRQLREMEQQLKDKDEREENLKRQLREMEQQLREKDEQEENSQRQLREMEQQLREKDEQEENLQGQLREMEQQLRQKDEQEENSQRQLREMEQRLREKGEQEENSQRQLREMEQQLREKDEQEENLQGQLREMEQQLRQKDEQEENSQRQLREMEQQLREKDEQEENLQGQVREMEQQLREKDEQEDNSQRQLSEMEQQLREKDEQEENLQRQLRGMEQQLTNVHRQFSDKEDETNHLQEHVTTLEGQVRAKEQEVNELQISLSTAQQALSEHQRQQSTADWVIPRDEIQLTDTILGRGAWGSVLEGKYCGSAVAVKTLHDLILSPHNRSLFEREMDIASRCRHPCLLQFIGATHDVGRPLFVTELMASSLRALLEQKPLSATEVSILSLDISRALNYLHQKKPSPIIHRDISSANVLLWRQGDQWRGKVSDYGTANFMQHTMTVGPGAAIYMAPEARTSYQTVKVDVYSFGVLLCEMCIRVLPDPERRDEQIVMVTSRPLRALIRRCLQLEPEARPNMVEIIEELGKPV